MGNSDKKFSMGWIPDYPYFRDYTENHEEINMNELIVREALRDEACSIKVKSFLELRISRNNQKEVLGISIFMPY